MQSLMAGAQLGKHDEVVQADYRWPILVWSNVAVTMKSLKTGVHLGRHVSVTMQSLKTGVHLGHHVYIAPGPTRI